MINARLHDWLKIALILGVIAAGVFYFAPHAFAQLEVPNSDLINDSIVTNKTFGETVLAIVNYILGFLGFLATLVFVYAGVLFVLNGGEEDLITKARKMMLYAVIGIIVIILSYTIVRFVTDSAGGTTRSSGSGIACQFDFDCPDKEWCVRDSASGKFACTDNPEKLLEKECFVTPDCSGDLVCYQNACVTRDEATKAGVQCVDSSQCKAGSGEVCWNNLCQPAPGKPGEPLQCFGSFQCAAGEFCTNGRCRKGNDTTCKINTDCAAPKTCDASGVCRNPNAGSGTQCTDNTDCSSGYVCNKTGNRCEFQGNPVQGGAGVSGSPAIAAAEKNLTVMDDLLVELDNALGTIADDINLLPAEAQKAINDILGKGSLADKIGRLEDRMEVSKDPAEVRVLERLISAMTHLVTLRDAMDELKTVMPESAETLQLWNETSEILDELIDSPTSSIKLRRFETKYRTLRDLVRRFPVVQARIRAIPGEGNVPFTVTFDGLDSIDPTGGTISDYKWTFLDNQGNEVSLGNSPVIVHEFTEANTYSVRLQTSTSLKDENGYKKATDGVSTVRIKANPPASQVRFRINGVEADDVHRVTIKEAQGGLIFDPSPTVPALGRTIQKYEWLFGDTATEIRSNPTTVVHTYAKPGEYFVKLVTTDSHGIKDQRVVKLFIKSLAADIIINPLEGNVNSQFTFRGITSRSDDGSINRYQWTIEDKEGKQVATSERESFSHQFERPGEYRVVLSVTDVTGSQDNIVKLLKVLSRPPVANFTHQAPKANHPNRIEFSAVGSYDPDRGDQIKYSWDFDGDGSFEVVDSKELEKVYEYKKAGSYKARLQVQDNFGKNDLVEKTVEILSVLSGDIVAEKRAIQAGQQVELKAESPNASSYLWEFGDGETASTEEKTVTHTYQRKGKYTVKLHFFDDDDGENTDTTSILVGNSDSPAAVIGYLLNNRDRQLTENLCGTGKNGLVITRADNVLLTAKDSVNTDGTNRLLSYDWRFSDGGQDSKKEFTQRFDQLTPENQCVEISLVVRDQINGKLSEEDLLLIKVVNELPQVTDFIIEKEKDKELVTPAKVHLRAVDPKDADGTIKRYRWWYFREGQEDEKLGLHATTVPQTDMTITAVGEPGITNRYFFVLELTDSDGGVWTTEERFLDVSSLEVKNGPNLSPVAGFTVDKTTISTGDSITFVSTSYDPQGGNLPNEAFLWDFDGDGLFDDTVTGPQVNRQFNTPGEYKVRLKVENRGLSSSATQTVFVSAVQSLPQAAFTYTIDGTGVRFDAGNSRYDPDLEDTTLRFEWDFDTLVDADGNGIKDDDVQSKELAPTFTYEKIGTFTVRLKVKDSLGMEGVIARAINLAENSEERERNSYHSLRVSSPNQPLTSLDITVTPARLSKSGTADIAVVILNADNSVYSGTVFFEVIEGSGEFSPNRVEARNSRAATIFNAVDSGIVRIRVRATGTYYGDLTEEATIRVTF